MSKTLKLSNFSHVKQYVEKCCCKKCGKQINFNNFFVDSCDYFPTVCCFECGHSYVNNDFKDEEFPSYIIINKWPEKTFFRGFAKFYHPLVEGKCRVCFKKYSIGDEYVTLSGDYSKIMYICCKECVNKVSLPNNLYLIHFVNVKIKLPTSLLNFNINMKLIRELHYSMLYLGRFDYLEIGPITEWVPIFSNFRILGFDGWQDVFVVYRSRDKRLGFVSYHDGGYSYGTYLTIYPPHITLPYYLRRCRKWKLPANSYLHNYDFETLCSILGDIRDDLNDNKQRTDKTFLPDLFNWVLKKNESLFNNVLYWYDAGFLRVVDNFHSHFFYEFMSRTFTQTLKKIPLTPTSKSISKKLKSSILIK
jgi:hypothetical protein